MRLAYDGTEINVYNQSLYDNSAVSSTREKKTKIPRFGGKKKNGRELKIGTSSMKSNMLQPMSDVASLQGGDLDKMSVVEQSAHGESNWRPENHDLDSDDSSGTMKVVKDEEGKYNLDRE